MNSAPLAQNLTLSECQNVFIHQVWHLNYLSGLSRNAPKPYKCDGRAEKGTRPFACPSNSLTGRQICRRIIVTCISIVQFKCDDSNYNSNCNGPLSRYVKLRVVHAPGMQSKFVPPPRVSDPDMHHGTCVMHLAGCMSGSLTSGFLWSWWWGKRSRHFQRMRNPQLCVSCKMPMAITINIMIS